MSVAVASVAAADGSVPSNAASSSPASASLPTKVGRNASIAPANPIPATKPRSAPRIRYESRWEDSAFAGGVAGLMIEGLGRSALVESKLTRSDSSTPRCSARKSRLRAASLRLSRRPFAASAVDAVAICRLSVLTDSSAFEIFWLSAAVRRSRSARTCCVSPFVTLRRVRIREAASALATEAATWRLRSVTESCKTPEVPSAATDTCFLAKAPGSPRSTPALRKALCASDGLVTIAFAVSAMTPDSCRVAGSAVSSTKRVEAE